MKDYRIKEDCLTIINKAKKPWSTEDATFSDCAHCPKNKTCKEGKEFLDNRSFL